MIQLILGGARSGKSALAEQLALQSRKKVIYIATATAGDEEMQQRISHHQQRRPDNWETIESPLDLCQILKEQARDNTCLLIDCLTLWISNQLCAEIEPETESQKLASILPSLPGEFIFVSNEVGMGIIPMGQLSRRFVDESGRLHQQLARICDRVIFTAAGLPLVMKGEPL